MFYVEVEKNVKILVQDLNSAGEKAVFFIHGWPVNHKMFEYQFNILPQYGFRCLSVDLRGFGGSDHPWEGYLYDRLADDIYKVIATLRIKELIMVGFSMGGPIAIRYMARHYGYKVCKLVLMAAAAPSFTQHPGYPYGMTKEAVNQLIIQTYKERPQMLSDFGNLFFAGQTTPNFMSWFQELGLEASGHGTIKTAESLRDADVTPDLGSIRVPTGIFHGALDKICPFEFAVILNQNIPGSELYRFEHSGHGVFYDELDRFNGTLRHFLNK